MIVSTQPPFLFIHIPKTAGTSIEESLYHYQDFEYNTSPHNIAQQYKDYLPRELFNEMFKFCFVRNPWDLMVSSYKYWIRQSGIDMTFTEWIEWRYEGGVIGDMLDRVTYEEGNEPSNIQNDKHSKLAISFYMNRTPQALFMVDETGNYLVDYIGRYEHINEDFNFIVDTLKLSDCYLPHSNSTFNESDPSDYREWYTDKTRKIVESRFALDIELFGYTFDGKLPHPGKCGLVKKDHSSFNDNGFKMPKNYYINLGGIPYGLYDIVYRHNESEEYVEDKKKNFKKEQIRSRINSLTRNIMASENSIKQLEDILYECEDELEVVNLQHQILKYREAELVFKIKQSKLQKELDCE
jgi:hypothetical protein